MRRVALAKRCFAEPGPYQAPVRYGPGSAAHRHSASKTRVNALMAKSYALRCVRGTSPVLIRDLRLQLAGLLDNLLHPLFRRQNVDEFAPGVDVLHVLREPGGIAQRQ